MEEKKICTKCNELKSLCEYYKASGRKYGVKSACKQCLKPVKQRHYQNNKEKYKLAYKEFKLRNPNYTHEYYLQKKHLIKNDS